jgi:uncharacterized membrane protein YqaE (UPF0057 family)
MLYLRAVVLPPLAVLLAGKPFQALLNIGLTILLWVPGMIHAILVVHNRYADKRQDRLIRRCASSASRRRPQRPHSVDSGRSVPKPGEPPPVRREGGAMGRCACSRTRSSRRGGMTGSGYERAPKTSTQ